VLLGAAIPAGWSLDFSIALTFMALLVLSVHRRSEAGAALVAAVVVLPALVLPHKLGLLVAAAVGIAAGLAAPLRAGARMSTGVLLLSMAACGLVTFLIRLSFIAFGQHLPNDPRFTAALRYVPPAILGALIAPEIFALNGSVSLAPDNPACGPRWPPCSSPA
jgi:uncharacterized membrane protein